LTTSANFPKKKITPGKIKEKNKWKNKINYYRDFFLYIQSRNAQTQLHKSNPTLVPIGI
jgi:hypothetical protein